jgi:sugar phosphate isomerase/epimerase
LVTHNKAFNGENAMRFGIMSMQIDSLIPETSRDTPPEQVLAHIAAFDHVGLVNSLADQGFNPIELSGDLALFFPNAFSQQTIERLLDLKQARDLSYTVHLPLWSIEPSTPLVQVRNGSVAAVIDTIRATQDLHPERYVLHATGALAAEFYQMRLPKTARLLLLRQFQSGARSSLKTILAETGLPSRKLAIETIEFPFELTLELAEELDLAICFDTGHVLVGFSGPIEFFEGLERCMPRLGEIHLHDAPRFDHRGKPRYGEDHRPLGTGDLEIARFLDRLEADNFNGPVIFELQVQQALASMHLIRSLRPELVD